MFMVARWKKVMLSMVNLKKIYMPYFKIQNTIFRRDKYDILNFGRAIGVLVHKFSILNKWHAF